MGCDPQIKTTVEPISTSLPKEDCGHERYKCKSGLCIWDSWLCDSSPDCETGQKHYNV
jgi:hypothetical protein